MKNIKKKKNTSTNKCKKKKETMNISHYIKKKNDKAN